MIAPNIGSFVVMHIAFEYTLYVAIVVLKELMQL